MPQFSPHQPADAELANDTTQIIITNLRGSRWLAPIDPQTYVEKEIDFDIAPRWPDWRVIQAQALLTGSIGRQDDGSVNTSFRLWDVVSGKQLLGQTYHSGEADWRRITNIISDAVYECMTGMKGNFDTP